MDALAKYSSEQERIDAPSTVVLRLVVLEKVLSMSAAGTAVTVIEDVEELEEGRTWSTTASERAGGWMCTSILAVTTIVVEWRG